MQKTNKQNVVIDQYQHGAIIVSLHFMNFSTIMCSFATLEDDKPECVPLPTVYSLGSQELSAFAWPTCGVSTIIPPSKLQATTCGDAQATLDAHNAARSRYGAPPLLWSQTLAEYAQTVSNTCNFQHSNGPWGENLAIGPGLSCKGAVDLWIAEERSWRPGGGFSSSTGHFTAAVWKSTLQVWQIKNVIVQINIEI